MKKIKILLVFLFLKTITYSQDFKIDSTNYCNYYDQTAHYKGSNIKSYNLTETMMIDIIYDEMIKLNFKMINKFRIINLGENKYITSICYSDKSNCGFLFECIYETTHSQEDRALKSINRKYSDYDYGEKIVFLDGSYKFVNIKEVPKNLHILKMNDYWYQQSTNEESNKKLVSIGFIIELLREDIRNFLKNFKP